MNYRLERINSEMQKSISEIIRERLKDPRVDAMVSVTKVDVARDLKTAKVYVGIYGNADEKKSSFDALVRCGGFIGHELSLDFKYLRTTPRLHFILDDSGEYGERIDRILEGLKKK